MQLRYVMVFSILAILSIIYYWLAKSFNIIDKPNGRSSHFSPTVRGGGIIFPIAVFMWWVLMDFQSTLMVLGLILISSISFWDDINGVSRKLRLIAQLVAVIFMFIDLGVFSVLPFWTVPILLIIVLGIINAVNFMDGINGITGLYSLLFFGSVFAFTSLYPSLKTSLVLYISISLFVFLFFNLRNKKALMFAGDIGSVSIAYLMVYFLIKLFILTGSWSVLILLLVYGLDSVGTLLQRLYEKENIFQPHRKHLYQYLANQFGWPHVLIAVLFVGFQAFVNYFFVLNHMEFPSNPMMLQIIGVGALLYVAIKIIVRNRVLKKQHTLQ